MRLSLTKRITSEHRLKSFKKTVRHDRRKQLFPAYCDAREQWPVRPGHLIEYFSRRVPGYFSDAPLGIHTLRGHFRRMEVVFQTLVDGSKSDVEIDPIAAGRVFSGDRIISDLSSTTQPSICASEPCQSGWAECDIPPIAKPPQVAELFAQENIW